MSRFPRPHAESARVPRPHAEGGRSPVLPVSIAVILFLLSGYLVNSAFKGFNASLDGDTVTSWFSGGDKPVAPPFANTSGLQWLDGFTRSPDSEMAKAFREKGYVRFVCRPGQGLRYELVGGGVGYKTLGVPTSSYSFPVSVGFAMDEDQWVQAGASDPLYPNLNAALHTCFEAAVR